MKIGARVEQKYRELSPPATDFVTFPPDFLEVSEKVTIFADESLTIKCKTMANSKKLKVVEPSIRAILCEFDYIFANLFAYLQRKY